MYMYIIKMKINANVLNGRCPKGSHDLRKGQFCHTLTSSWTQRTHKRVVEEMDNIKMYANERSDAQI